MRLSEKDANEKKTMNTHLHILEPYTNLMRIWKNAEIERAQQNLINIFTDKILNRETNHLNLFFDENWKSKSTAISYGHDIEASWLLFEAAEVLNDKPLLEKIKAISLKIADAAMEGLQPDGSMIYEKVNGHGDKDRHWWVQAETVTGLMYAWKNSGNALYREKSQMAWDYIRRQIIDTDNGEWYWSRFSDGQINRSDDKAGFWKCPYHNGRMCLEAMNNE
jgi:mannobiose 2-epimerase